MCMSRRWRLFGCARTSARTATHAMNRMRTHTSTCGPTRVAVCVRSHRSGRPRDSTAVTRRRPAESIAVCPQATHRQSARPPHPPRPHRSQYARQTSAILCVLWRGSTPLAPVARAGGGPTAIAIRGSGTPLRRVLATAMHANRISTPHRQPNTVAHTADTRAHWQARGRGPRGGGAHTTPARQDNCAGSHAQAKALQP